MIKIISFVGKNEMFGNVEYNINDFTCVSYSPIVPLYKYYQRSGNRDISVVLICTKNDDVKNNEEIIRDDLLYNQNMPSKNIKTYFLNEAYVDFADELYLFFENEIQINDHIVFDATHGTKNMTMHVFPLINFLKESKQITADVFYFPVHISKEQRQNTSKNDYNFNDFVELQKSNAIDYNLDTFRQELLFGLISYKDSLNTKRLKELLNNNKHMTRKYKSLLSLFISFENTLAVCDYGSIKQLINRIFEAYNQITNQDLMNDHLLAVKEIFTSIIDDFKVLQTYELFSIYFTKFLIEHNRMLQAIIYIYEDVYKTIGDIIDLNSIYQGYDVRNEYSKQQMLKDVILGNNKRIIYAEPSIKNIWERIKDKINNLEINEHINNLRNLQKYRNNVAHGQLNGINRNSVLEYKQDFIRIVENLKRLYIHLNSKNTGK